MGGQDEKSFTMLNMPYFLTVCTFDLTPIKCMTTRKHPLTLSRYPLFSILSNYDHPLEYGKMWCTVQTGDLSMPLFFLLIPPTCMQDVHQNSTAF